MRYSIQKQCPCTFCEEKGCQSCNYTGWRDIYNTDDRDKAIQLRDYWKRFFGGDLKVRIKIKGKSSS